MSRGIFSIFDLYKQWSELIAVVPVVLVALDDAILRVENIGAFENVSELTDSKCLFKLIFFEQLY